MRFVRLHCWQKLPLLTPSKCHDLTSLHTSNSYPPTPFPLLFQIVTQLLSSLTETHIKHPPIIRMWDTC